LSNLYDVIFSGFKELDSGNMFIWLKIMTQKLDNRTSREVFAKLAL